MNKLQKIIISILGGCNVFMDLATPIFLVWVFLELFGMVSHWSTYLLIIVGIFATLFRGIKFIVKKDGN